MNLNSYLAEAQDTLSAAQQLARDRQHQSVECEHLLQVLLSDPKTGLAKELRAQEIDVDKLQRRLSLELAKLPKVLGGSHYLSPRFLELTSRAEVLSRELGVAKVSPQILCAALADPSFDSGAAGLLLREAGGKAEAIAAIGGKSAGSKKQAAAHKPKSKETTTKGALSDDDKDAALLQFGRDLTQLAREGKLDPVVGRHVETRRLQQVLSRRSKNNPVLIGEPGVGKTAIIEGLAQRIASGDVPSSLTGKRLIALDVGALLAGAKLRGQFEERLRGIIRAVTESAGQIILFIDEIHTLVGAGSGDGAMDASNLLKPALARGELHCMGSTTPDEYRKYIEKDAALERRFAPIHVDPTDEAQTLSILRVLKSKFEVHHGLRISQEALEAATSLSKRYISGRALPDKAVDLIDEAASRLRLDSESMPSDLDAMRRRSDELSVERRALEQDLSDTAKVRKAEVEAELKTLRSAGDALHQRWQNELELIRQVRALKSSLEKLQQEQLAAERDADLDEAARLRFGAIPQMQEALEQAQHKLDLIEDPLVREAVSAADVAAVVASWTGIPVNRMLEAERDKLVHMEQRLHQRVIGQAEAISAVAKAVRRARAGLKDPKRPIGSFFFLGPTGVGKTELARALAEFLFDDEQAIVRLDMSEFMEKHAAVRLVGSPPGYVGYDEGGQLTEAVRQRPYSAVLFDEVEKAHPDVFNLLLQLLDDGRLSDSQGRVVDFKNTVIVMTSNIGSADLLEGTSAEGQISPAARQATLNALHRHFRPEFLNRIDDIVLFHPLNREHIGQIAQLQLRGLKHLLAAQDLRLQVSPEAMAYIADQGYEPAFGARPLKRAITRLLQDPLSLQILEGRFSHAKQIVVEFDSRASTLIFNPQG